MNRIFLLGLSVIFSVLLFSCKSGKEGQNGDLQKQGYIKAKIKDYRGLDGCTFLIEPESGGRIEPVGLPADFQTDGLLVWVKYKTPEKAMVSICMAGKMVQIIDIKKR